MRSCAGFALVQIQLRKHILDQAEYAAPIWHPELDHADQESKVGLENLVSLSRNQRAVRDENRSSLLGKRFDVSMVDLPR